MERGIPGEGMHSDIVSGPFKDHAAAAFLAITCCGVCFEKRLVG